MLKASLLLAALVIPTAAAAQGMQGMQGQGQGQGQNRASAFQQLDGNGDGSLTWSEVSQRHSQSFAAMDKNGDKSLSSEEFSNYPGSSPQGQSMRAGRFASFDANGDSRLTFEEYSNGHRATFQKADANQDGQVSQQELSGMGQGQHKPMQTR